MYTYGGYKDIARGVSVIRSTLILLCVICSFMGVEGHDSAANSRQTGNTDGNEWSKDYYKDKMINLRQGGRCVNGGYVPQRGVVPPPTFDVTCNGITTTFTNYTISVGLTVRGVKSTRLETSWSGAVDTCYDQTQLMAFGVPIDISSRPVDEPITPGAQCEELKYCFYGYDCDYSDWNELCSVPDDAAEMYPRNCLVVRSLARNNGAFKCGKNPCANRSLVELSPKQKNMGTI